MEKPEKSKTRVCFVSPKAYPLFNPDIESVFGGAEVDTYMIATELAKDDGFEVSFIVADYGQPEEETRENVRILKSLNFKQNPLSSACKIWKALKQVDADVYMMKTASAGVPLVQYFCQKYKKHFIYKTAHQRECNGSYLRNHKLIGNLFLRSLRKANALITQNLEDAESLLQLHQLKAITIPNAHRIPKTTEIQRKWILWVGRSVGFKHPERFLKLATSFPEEKFVMICQKATGDIHYDDLKADAAKIGNLEFIERVPFGEVDGYFQQSKVFVNTSDSEGFPNTFIQACKAGAAILSYAVNPDGFLDEHQCGVCCENNEQRLDKQLRQMLCDNRCQQLGSNGLGYVRDRHDIAKIIERYKKLFMNGGK